MHRATLLTLLIGCALLAGATRVIAHGCSPSVAQVVALDECDPDTFNLPIDKGGLRDGGTGFCHNVALKAFGYATSLPDLVAKAKAGTPDPGWDFEPDQLTIQRGTMVTVADQGGEPHTFTEVAHFAGGFIKDLNHGEPTVSECEGGFSNVAVAKTRIVQGGHMDITGLSKGKHLFQCCIHPWMRMEIDVN
jgi:plastocyanin